MNDKAMNVLSDEQLEGVSGGYIFDASVLTPNGSDLYPWEILDWNGNVVDRCASYVWAENLALERGYSCEELTWEQVQRLRETGSPY